MNSFVLDFIFELDGTFLEKKNEISQSIDSSKISGVPSYTPAKNGGDPGGVLSPADVKFKKDALLQSFSPGMSI